MVSSLPAKIETTVRPGGAGYIVADPRLRLWPAPRCPGKPRHNWAVARVPIPRANLARLAAGAGLLAYGLGALVVARGPGELTTYAGRSDAVAALAVAAGLALVAAGLITSFGRPAGRIGDLALLAGLAWFAPFWAGWLGGQPLVRSLGTLAAGLAFPLLLHLVLAYPSGRLHPNSLRALVVAVYLEAALSVLGRALFRDPFFDPNCWNNCIDNIFLVHSLPGVARGIQDVDLWFAVAAGAALATICIWRLIAATAPARRALWPVLAGGIALAIATIAHSVALDRMPLEDPSAPAFLSIFVVDCAAVIVLALGLFWAVLRTRVQRRSVARIVAELGEAPPPGSLESALAAALDDPDLRVAYWLPASRRYVDGRGRAVEEPVAWSGRAVTPFVRAGRRVAVVTHAATVTGLEREIGAAVRLALENERLQAEVLAQLYDLRVSRTRIVETGDAERRRLERDLHDSAQQRLLALSYDLRVAGADAEVEGDTGTASLLVEATAEAQAALGELRELAHGIHPAILTEAGLGPALATLADSAPLPIEIGETARERYAAPVETTAYLVVAEAIEDAARRRASHAAVSTVRDDERLVIEVADDGSGRTSTMIHLADRVGAVGGRLEIEATTLRAEIPCA
jgi:signal transduction histidine kinase